MNKLLLQLGTRVFTCVAIISLTACTLPWMQEEDIYDITSKFKATWNVHENFERHGDGSITFYSVKYGGLVGLVREHNLPVDWSGYESITFEFEDTTQVETQLLIGNVMRSWGKRGINKLTCYFDGLDMRQVDQVVLQTAEPTILTIKRVRLTPVTTSWNSRVVWKGNCNTEEWTSGFVVKPEKLRDAKEGDKIEFVFSTDTSDPKRSYWLLKSVYNSTEHTLEGNKNEQNEWGCTMVGQKATSYRIRLTARDAKELRSRGIFVNGYFVNLTQVNLLTKIRSADQPGEESEEEKASKGYRWE